MSREKLYFIIIVLVLALGQVSADVYLPAFPTIAINLNTDINTIQFSLSLYMLGFGSSQLFYGPLSDALGRRKPLLFGLTLTFLGSLICAAAHNSDLFLWGRLIQGLGAGATLTLGGSMMRDLFEGEQLAKYGSYGTLISVALLATAPLIGSYWLTWFGWRAIFIFLCGYIGFLIAAFLFFFPETNRYLHQNHIKISTLKKNLITLCNSRIFIGYTFCSLLTYGALLAWIAAGPVVLLEHIHISPVTFGWIYTLTGIAFAIGAVINSQCVTIFGLETMLRVGTGILLLSGLIMLALSLVGYLNVVVIIGPVFLMLLAASLIFPNSAASLLTPFPHIAGLASSLFYGFRLLGGALFSAFIAFFLNQNQTPMACIITVSGLLSMLTLLWIRAKKPASQTIP